MSFTAQSLIDSDTENKYLYNGKELQDDLGLMLYDYEWRQYDPILGRFTTIDPMIEDHYDYTGYAYVYNNPINLIDPFGLDTLPAVVDPNTNELVHDPEESVEIEEVVIIEDRDPESSSEESDSETEQAELTELETDEDKNPAGKIMAGTLLLAGAMVADDVTVIGVADDPAIPFVIVGGAIVAGSVWIYHQFAHKKKKQSSGKSGLDRHDRQYTHGGKNRPKNPNQKKGAEKRRNKGKRN